ncbi:MAG: response regulator [Alphaproteobacteria bacterium]|nr:response regulator [Alphaproteobacteria bacterium]
MESLMRTIPICMFPTKVILIDDDLSSLKDLELNLDDSRFTYQFYNNPQQALTALTKNYQPDSFAKRLISQPDETKWQHAMLDVNIYDLMNEIYNPKRFESISTVVVDFTMPGMNGLEICEKITDPSLQKILLTGEADENLAVQAFNKGLIHRYIKKQDPNVFKILNQSLKDAQRTYFSKVSQLMLDVATFNTKKTCLRDPVFIEFFEKLLQEKNIIEYYLFEITGNFLLLDENGTAYGLFIYDKDQLNMWHEDLPESESVPPQLLKELKSHKTMICFHDKNSISIPAGAQWAKYSYPLHILQGSHETYYYAFAKNMVDIELGDISTFQNYKKEYQQNSFPKSF